MSILAVKGVAPIRTLPLECIAEAGVLLWNGLSHAELSRGSLEFNSLDIVFAELLFVANQTLLHIPSSVEALVVLVC